MTASLDRDAAPLTRARVPDMVERLESRIGPRPAGLESMLFHLPLLDVLDRGEYDRCVVWPPDDPVAICHVGSGGRLLPAGDAAAAPAFARTIGGSSWQVLIGHQPLGDAMIARWGRGLFRRRTTVREQRLMRALPDDIADLDAPDGMRGARPADVDEVTELAARLHVEDLMRPPLSRAGRQSLRARMANSIERGDTVVVEHRGRVVAKTDVSLFNAGRGAQLAGVYVVHAHRAKGIGAAMVAALSRSLVLEGLPGVTLHVRADNTGAIRAYERAGFADVGPLTLAVR